MKNLPLLTSILSFVLLLSVTFGGAVIKFFFYFDSNSAAQNLVYNLGVLVPVISVCFVLSLFAIYKANKSRLKINITYFLIYIFSLPAIILGITMLVLFLIL
jgi:undecaprenyl pyrophosphate phosphatase UppP